MGQRFERAMAPRVVAACAAAALCAVLAGCVEDAPQLAAASAATPASDPVVARPGVSPRGAPLAVASLEGAPQAVLDRFGEQTRAAAATRDVAMVAPSTAAYLARGYLTAYPVDGGSVLAAVWDLYDQKRRRVQRLEDYVQVKSTGGDAWAAADDAALAALAARSADDIAATLTNTPEAIAAAGKAPVVAMVPDEAPARLPTGASAFR